MTHKNFYRFVILVAIVVSAVALGVSFWVVAATAVSIPSSAPATSHKAYLPLIAKPVPLAATVVEPGGGGVLTSADGRAEFV